MIFALNIAGLKRWWRRKEETGSKKRQENDLGRDEGLHWTLGAGIDEKGAEKRVTTTETVI